MNLDRQDREKAVKQALANGALEKLNPSPHFTDLLNRYISGEISVNYSIEYVKVQRQQSSNLNKKMSE